MKQEEKEFRKKKEEIIMYLIKCSLSMAKYGLSCLFATQENF